MDSYNLQRFIEEQETDYEIALREMKEGYKQSHWIWYIFPQITGLGMSYTSELFAIKSLEEAKAYLEHPVLGPRLLEISRVLLENPSSDARKVMGYPDDLKLCSSMTLFECANPKEPLFGQVLDKFFDGKRDERTIEMLEKIGH